MSVVAGKQRGRWLIAGVALALVTAPVAVGSRPVTGPVVVPPARIAEAVGEDAAFAAARRQGENVVVASLTTATRKVSAAPDGSLVAEVTTAAARVRRGQGWVEADPTLAVGPDRTVAPRTVAQPLVFSGGGDRTMVSFGEPGRSLKMSWPAPLPEPKLDGATATYPNVLPDVDLVLRAQTDGVAQQLVVKTAEAAANPALRSIKLALTTDGLSVAATPTGALEAKDASGAVVFQAPPSTMWDASGDRQAAVGVAVAGTELTLTPDLALLTDPKAAFPITIDPDWRTFDRSDWTKVFSGKPESRHWYGADDVDTWAKVGTCTGWAGCNGIGTARSYWQFDTRFLEGKRIISANLNATIVYGPSCNTRNHELWMANATINQDTRWNAMPGGWRVDTRPAESAYSGCAGNKGIGFNVNQNNGLCTTCWSAYFIKAENEGDNMAWRKYDALATKIVVNYNSRPNPPTQLATDPPLPTPCKWCDGVPYVGDDHIRLIGKLTDPDPDNLTAVWDVYGGPSVEHSEGPTQVSGSTFSKTLDLRNRDGQFVSWTLWARDGYDGGDWLNGPGRPFRPDRVGIDVAPGVAGDLYQQDNAWHGGVGVPGKFTFTASGVADVDHYLYGWNDPPSTSVDADALGGKAVVDIAPVKDGPQTLYVQSVDRAGHRSPTTTYRIYVRSGNGPVAQWSFEGNAKDTAFLASHDGTTTGATSYGTGAVGSALTMDGSGAHMSAPNTVRTDGSFTVAAWAKLDRDPGGDVALSLLSQDGAVNSGFFLDYRSDPNGDVWEFLMPSADTVQRPSDSLVRSGPIAKVGEWTHLSGVYDAPAGQVRLYVNGVLAGSAPRTGGFNATGPLRVGRATWEGNPTNFWQGSVDEAQVYDRVLTPAEIGALVSRANVQLGYWKFDDGDSTTALNAVAGGAMGVLRGGARFVADGAVNGSVRLDKAEDFVSTGAPVVRTDQSFSVSAWAKLDQDPGGDQATTVLSQDGAVNSGFSLAYRSDAGGDMWEFYLPSADAVSRPADSLVRSARIAKPGVWTHLTGVYDAPTKQIRIYVDGELSGTATRTAGFNATGPLLVGRGRWQGTSPANPWIGGVDEVRAYGRVLSAEEIKGIVSRDNVAVGNWKLDGNLKDSSPRSLNGTAAGTADYTGGQTSMPDPTDLALRFDGTANASTSTAHAVDTNQSFSVAAWARVDQGGALRTVVSEDGANVSAFKLRARDDGKWSFAMFDGDAVDDGSKRADAAGGSVQVGQWTHLVGIYDAPAKQIQLYVNGTLVGSAAHTHTWNAPGGFQIGRAKWSGGPVEYFKGAIDDVAAYSRTLFAAEIQTMAGRDLTLIHNYPFDETSGRTAGDAVGAKTATLGTGAAFGPGRVGNAVTLDGTGAATTTGVDLRTDQAFSVSAWVRLPNKDCDLATPTTVCKIDAVTVDGAKTSKFRLGHVIDADNNQFGAWTFEMPESDVANAVVTKAVVSTLPSEVDTWTHLVGLYDPAVKKIWLYVNGSRVGDGTLNTPWLPTGGLVVGRGKVNGQPAEFWPGSVDDVRLYTGALDSDRISALVRSYPAQTGPAALPVADAARWDLDEHTGTTTADATGRGKAATLTAGASWVGGRSGPGALMFNGGNGFAQTSGPVLDTTKSFSSTAWVYLTKPGVGGAVLGQDGNRLSSFVLGYGGEDEKWWLVVPTVDKDAPGSAVTVLASAETAVSGEWTHLAMSYDADAHQVRLYVNGTLSAVRVGVSVLPSSGPFTIGRDRWDGVNGSPFSGAVDDVRVFGRAIGDDEVRKVHDDVPDADLGYYRFDDGTATDVTWRKGKAVLSGGTSFGPGVTGQALQLNGTTGFATGPAPRVPMRDSFAVAGWARLANDTQVSTIVSQDGDRNSGFVLQYRPDVKRWVFGAARADQDGSPLVYAASAVAPAVNQWAHVEGVYDYPARQLRLYVDGELVGTRNGVLLWPATGSTVFGRAKADGQPTGFFAGSLDEVRLSEGPVTDGRIAVRGGWAAPEPGQLGRFVDAAGDRSSGATDHPRAGTHLDTSLGRLVTAGENTKALYACRAGVDSFTSADAACDGASVVGPIGSVYAKQPTNIPTIAVYQCATASDRFESRAAACEGATSKGLLGYTAAYATFARYNLDGFDHSSTTEGAPAAYRAEGPQGLLDLAGQTGTQQLYQCRTGSDFYPSTDQACEGATVVGPLGGVWTAAPEGVDSQALYRCSFGGERFVSLQADCEGQTVEKKLGYALLRAPAVTAVFE